MLVPLKWLKEYVNIDDININTLSDGMIMSGSNIETVETLGEDMDKVVVGKILEITSHPNADKLVITKVDIGSEVIQIVTGATNIKEGQYVPIVLAGGFLPGGLKIKKGKLRGEESNGMMCSAKELGIPDKVVPVKQRDGIFILDREYPLGQDIREVMGLKGHIIEFEITSNRPDCLSILGIARETAATFNKPFGYPQISLKEEAGDKNLAEIEVLNNDLCKRYVARTVTDVKIEESPLWLQIKLMEAGMRPINNIVDITNYVMLEMGQPLHAFDLSTVAENRIIVKNAQDGDSFITLDGASRKLDSSMLMINDGEKAVGIAGVMGGENSEITDETKTILLESANFDADSIRKTSKKLSLRTEASSRFEKGIDPNICLDAANRVCQLIEELGAGKVVKNIIDIYPQKIEEKEIKIRPSRVNELLGTNIDKTHIKEIFTRLEIQSEIVEETIIAKAPTFRLDLLEEIDFVEEVARIYGFDNLPVTLPKGNTQGAKTNGQIIEDYTKNILNSVGFSEILTYSFVSPKGLDKIATPEDSFLRRTIRLINPLGEETSTMRTTMMPNMLEVMARNYNRGVEEVKAFELGRVFLPKELPVTNLPIEKLSLSMGMYGGKNDFFVMKGAIVALIDKLGVDECKFIPEKNHSSFHPGRCASIQYGNHILGVFGEVHPDVGDNYGVDIRFYLAELDFNLIMQLAKLERVYKGLARYPAISRDIALVVKEDIYVNEIEEIIKENGKKLLEKIELFDVYQGKQIQEGYKSVAYKLIYRAEDRTLTDEEVGVIHDKIINELNKKLDATLRE